MPLLRGARRAAGRRAAAHGVPALPGRLGAPRAVPAACAAEAARRQRAFWEMHDALFADQGRLEDPHLWARAEALGLDLARFDADRRSAEVAAVVREQFRGGVRAGVATTPTLFVERGGDEREARGRWERHGRPDDALWARLIGG